MSEPQFCERWSYIWQKIGRKGQTKVIYKGTFICIQTLCMYKCLLIIRPFQMLHLQASRIFYTNFLNRMGTKFCEFNRSVTNRGRCVRRELERSKQKLLVENIAEKLPLLESSPVWKNKESLLFKFTLFVFSFLWAGFNIKCYVYLGTWSGKNLKAFKF